MAAHGEQPSPAMLLPCPGLCYPLWVRASFSGPVWEKSSLG